MDDFTNFIDGEGNFSDSTALVGLAGEGYEETKMFEGVTNIGQLVKFAADNKSFVGKKLENVIQRPDKDNPDDVSAFHKSLLKELGSVEKMEDLDDMNWRDGIPDGIDVDQKLIDAFSRFIIDESVPKPLAMKMTGLYNKVMMEAYTETTTQQQAALDAETKATETTRQEQVAAITKEMPGDKMQSGLRGVLKIVDFMANDELKTKIKEADLYTNPSVDSFEKAGISLDNILPFAKLASAIDTAKLVNSGGGGEVSDYAKKKAIVMRDYPGLPADQVEQYIKTMD